MPLEVLLTIIACATGAGFCFGWVAGKFRQGGES